jgi:hypothetical protein
MQRLTNLGYPMSESFITSFNISDEMTRNTREQVSPTFLLETAQLVVDPNDSIREAAGAMNAGS